MAYSAPELQRPAQHELGSLLSVGGRERGREGGERFITCRVFFPLHYFIEMLGQHGSLRGRAHPSPHTPRCLDRFFFFAKSAEPWFSNCIFVARWLGNTASLS